MRLTKERKERLVTVVLVLAIAIAGWMLLFDLGNSQDQPAGAGEIWWTQVPLIEAVYQSMKEN